MILDYKIEFLKQIQRYETDQIKQQLIKELTIETFEKINMSLMSMGWQ